MGKQDDDVVSGVAAGDHAGFAFHTVTQLRHLAETGALARDASGRWSTTGAVTEMVLPPSVQMVIGSRVGRLGREAERVLSLAAVTFFPAASTWLPNLMLN